jgi:uncharacterized delta-60 repeat protein
MSHADGGTAMRKIWLHAMVGLSTAGLLLSVSFAKTKGGPGSLDPSFGKGGIVSTTKTNVAPVYAMQQSTGDIVVFGQGPTFNSLGLLRYTPSGQLDTTFGTDGITITFISSYAFTKVGMAVQPNDDIIVVNAVFTLTGENNITLFRYTPDGALDPTFGNGGMVVTSGLGASALLLQPNGQIVVAGGGPAARGGTLPTTLVRYNSDGTLDTSFGTGGIAQAPTGSPEPSALALLSNGDYLSVELESSENQPQSSVLEFNSAGVLQSQLTQASPTATSAPTSGFAPTLFQSNGEYVVVTRDYVEGPVVTLLAEATRFGENGEVDPTFSSTPFSFSSKGNESEAFAAAYQSNGQLVVGGQLLNTESSPILADYALARLDTNGTVDSTFGDAGTVTGSESKLSFVAGLLIQQDGKIVALTSTAIARFLAN